MSITIGPYTQGEVPLDLVVTFTDAAGAPINITGADVTGSHLLPDATVVERTATVTGGPAGEVTYEWDDDDLADFGVHALELWVSIDDHLIASERFVWLTRPAIGSPTDVFSYRFVPGSTNKPLFECYFEDQGDPAGWTANYMARKHVGDTPVLDETGTITRVAPSSIDPVILAGLPAALATADAVWHILFAAPPSIDTQDLLGVYRFAVDLLGPSAENVPVIPSGRIRFDEDPQ